MKIIIKNINTADCISGYRPESEIFIRDEVLSERFDESEADRIIDGGGLTALPGIVDIHVHFRDPGQTHKEDILSGAAAAAAGGVTSVIAMPNTLPPVDSPEVLRDITARAEKAPINIYQAACITRGMKSTGLTDFDALKAAGAAAFSDDGLPVRSDELMENALVKAKSIGLPVLSHSEVLSLAEGGKVNEGEISRTLGVRGMPAQAEFEAIGRETSLAQKTGCPLHICHVSTAESIRIIREAKAKGVPVTCETGPHYFWFTEEKLLGRDADFRMNPPLRTEEDRLAVINGLRDGTIDAIATDHAPHSAEEKSDFISAPNGVVGLETSLAASYTTLVRGGIMDIANLSRIMSYNPANIAGLPGGSLEPGQPADILLFYPDEEWTVEPGKFSGRSKNTPFKGMKLFGRVEYTFCRGKLVYKR